MQIIKKLARFLKKNVYYVLLFACVLAVGTMITVTVVATAPEDNLVIEAPDTDKGDETPEPTPEVPDDKPSEDQPSEDVVAKPIVFIAPVGGEILCQFSDTELVYCSTLKQWQTHTGIDYTATEGESVKCVYEGTVLEVTNDMLSGNVVKVDHGDGLVTVYGALEEVTVKVGDKVTQGSQLGVAGNTALSEVNLGTHVHFETILDGKSINPIVYSGENK